MKLYLLVGLPFRVSFLLLLLGGLQACKTPPSEPAAPAESELVGEWKITGIQVSPQQNGTSDALALANSLTGNTCVSQVIIGFDPTHQFHLDYAQAPGCYQAKTDYLGYFTGVGGQQWALANDQLVLVSKGQQTQQGQTTDVTAVAARYQVRIKGDQMSWRYQVQRDQQVNPNQTVFNGSSSIQLTYTITLQNVWRPQ